MGLLELAIVALVISVLAGAQGWTGVARGAATVAKVTFGVFLALAVVLLALVALGIGAIA